MESWLVDGDAGILIYYSLNGEDPLPARHVSDQYLHLGGLRPLPAVGGSDRTNRIIFVDYAPAKE